MDVAYASARDRLGQTLCGSYHLDEIVGVGGTAVVFRATDRDGRRVAVKLLHDYLCKSRDITRRFLREAYLANLLEHPGTVRVLDDDTDDTGVAFLVLELLDGETLEERRVRLGGRLPVDDVLGYMDCLLEVLELAHEKNIVHRDIKPSNVFLTKDGTLKVLDFGIARILDEHGGATATKTGQTIGTPAFMPPEQALSKPKEIDTQTDLWAVGATMFTLLSGELVHVAESSSEHLVKAATQSARSVAYVLPGVPSNVERLVGRALRFDKKDRWASAKEMRDELARVRLDPGRPIGTTSSPPPRNPESTFPTVIVHRDSDKTGLRETGMTVAGDAREGDVRSRRAIFLSTTAAALLVATALTFGIWMTVIQPPKLPARPIHDDNTARTFAAPSLVSTDAPNPDSPLPGGSRLSADVGATDPPSARARGSIGPSVATIGTTRALLPANSADVATRRSPAKGAGKPPAGKHPHPASITDLYKPF